ncbi:MAG: hypothetical protein Q8P16_01745, partial [bacterium]|nr:hypothetical protein [bacterium]
MHILHVTPIARARGTGRLSYFSVRDIPVGSIVFVPLRNKEVPALVLEKEDARALKAILRTNIYATKKIQDKEPLRIFSPEFIRASLRIADYFAAPPGAVLKSYIPSAILERADEALLQPGACINEGRGGSYEKLVLQLPRQERLEKHKTIVRGALAQNKSVLLCTSSVHEAKELYEYYRRGIEKYTFCLHGAMTKKQQYDTWSKAVSERHPVLLVVTPGFVSIPRCDLSVYIIERESSAAYKRMVSPFTDARVLIEEMAKQARAMLLVADTFVTVKTHDELARGVAHEFEERARRVRSGAPVTLIDLAAVRKKYKEEKAEFPVLSPEALALLTATSEKREAAFVFAARRGISPQTVCRDCGTLVHCAHCAAPVVLHESTDGRILLCHRCGASRNANETCIHCKSWNLVSLGIGIERITEYLTRAFPDVPVFRIDSDTIKTPKQAADTMDAFENARPAVLVGTEMALPLIREPVAVSIASSLDSLFSVPDFRIEEKVFGLVTALRVRTVERVVVETSDPKNAMLVRAASGNIAEYVREELRLRESLRYPPFTVFIKVTHEGA